MTQHMVDLLRAVARHVSMGGPVLEVGSYIEANQDHFDLRRVFEGAPYLGVDVNEGPGVDRVMDLLDMPQVMSVVADFSPRVTLCLYVLEHTWEIQKAVRGLVEIWKTHPESWLWVSTHQNQPFHGTPNYPDYWRVTVPGLRRLLSEAGIGDAHVLVHPEVGNPSDVLAIRQPNSMAWPDAAIARAVAETGAPWEYLG